MTLSQCMTISKRPEVVAVIHRSRVFGPENTTVVGICVFRDSGHKKRAIVPLSKTSPTDYAVLPTVLIPTQGTSAFEVRPVRRTLIAFGLDPYNHSLKIRKH